MGPDGLVAKIQGLSDLELAILVCLTAGQHCLIDTEPEALESISQELQLVSSHGFKLHYRSKLS